MAWQNQKAPGRGLVSINLSKKVDWDKLWKSVRNNGKLPEANLAGTSVQVDSSFEGQKDEGKMTDGTYRFDIQSINSGYVNWQIQSGAASYAGVLIKCDTWYTFDDLETQLILSAQGGVLRKDA